MARRKGWKRAEYWMYFPFFSLRRRGKRSAVPPEPKVLGFRINRLECPHVRFRRAGRIENRVQIPDGTATVSAEAPLGESRSLDFFPRRLWATEDAQVRRPASARFRRTRLLRGRRFLARENGRRRLYERRRIFVGAAASPCRGLPSGKTPKARPIGTGRRKLSSVQKHEIMR